MKQVREKITGSESVCLHGGGFTYGLWFQGRKGSGYCGR